MHCQRWHDEWSVSIIARLRYIQRMLKRLLLLLPRWHRRKQVSHLELIVRPAGQCHPNNGYTSHGGDFISETVTLASPSAPFCCRVYRHAVRHQRRTFMNDWLLITWHWRRWIINVVVIWPRRDPSPARVIRYPRRVTSAATVSTRLVL